MWPFNKAAVEFTLLEKYNLLTTGTDDEVETPTYPPLLQDLKSFVLYAPANVRIVSTVLISVDPALVEKTSTLPFTAPYKYAPEVTAGTTPEAAITSIKLDAVPSETEHTLILASFLP